MDKIITRYEELSSMFQDNYFQDKVALVTGAGQGIGRTIAITLAKAGCFVVINDVNKNNAKEVCSFITAAGHESTDAIYDISNDADVQKMSEEILSRFGKLDILVNNAGVVSTGSLFETSEEEWEHVMSVNLKGTFLTTKYFGEHMCQQKFGKIVNIASVAGKKGGGFFGNSVYAASKAGVMALTKGAAREFGPYSVNVNAITPGNISTSMTQNMTAEQMEKVLANVPLSRSGKPEDVANAVLYLVSPLSEYIAGEIMDVDGGLMLD